MNRRIDELNRVANTIEQHIRAAVARWYDLQDKALSFRPSENDWSTKEIIGHLIDSASNNHQRFVRLQLTDRLNFPDYGQDNIHWVRIQNYQHHPWHDLLGLWRYFNLQLTRIMRCVDPSCLTHVWQIDGQTCVTLFDLMTDYLRHLENHLDQISAALEEFKKR
jgi:hypothetical protein